MEEILDDKLSKFYYHSNDEEHVNIDFDNVILTLFTSHFILQDKSSLQDMRSGDDIRENKMIDMVKSNPFLRDMYLTKIEYLEQSDKESTISYQFVKDHKEEILEWGRKNKALIKTWANDIYSNLFNSEVTDK